MVDTPKLPRKSAVMGVVSYGLLLTRLGLGFDANLSVQPLKK